MNYSEQFNRMQEVFEKYFSARVLNTRLAKCGIAARIEADGLH
jgi:hypothetical protein